MKEAFSWRRAEVERNATRGLFLRLRHSIDLARHSVALVPGILLLGLAWAWTGCLSRPALTHQTFALQPTIPKGTNANGQGILAIRSVEVSPLFEGRSFIYRFGNDEFEADPYAEFLVPPTRALTVPIRAILRHSGLFANVIEPGSRLEPDRVLEVYAQELYGDFRKGEPSTAVLSLRLLLFGKGNGHEQNLILQKEYTRREPLKETTAAALAAGWSQALGEIMSEAINDFAAVQGKANAPQAASR